MQTNKEYQNEKKLIQKALNLFSKIVQEKKRSYKRQEKFIKRFMKVAKETHKHFKQI